MFWWFFCLFVCRWWHRSGSWRSSRIYRKILLHLAVLVLLSFSPIRKFSFWAYVFVFAWFVSFFYLCVCGFCVVLWLDAEVLSFFFFFFLWKFLIWELDADFLKILCVCMFNNCLFLWIWLIGLWFEFLCVCFFFINFFSCNFGCLNGKVINLQFWERSGEGNIKYGIIMLIMRVYLYS